MIRHPAARTGGAGILQEPSAHSTCAQIARWPQPMPEPSTQAGPSGSSTSSPSADRTCSASTCPAASASTSSARQELPKWVYQPATRSASGASAASALDGAPTETAHTAGLRAARRPSAVRRRGLAKSWSGSIRPPSWWRTGRGLTLRRGIRIPSRSRSQVECRTHACCQCGVIDHAGNDGVLERAPRRLVHRDLVI